MLKAFEQLEQQVKSSRNHEPHATHISKAKAASRLSIGSLMSSVNDPEIVLPVQLSIASPTFYEEVIVKEEDDNDIECDDADIEVTTTAKSVALDPAVDNIPADLPVDAWSRNAHALDPETDMANPMRALLADEVNFDISDMAKMINMETSFIPTVMDFFNVLHNFV